MTKESDGQSPNPADPSDPVEDVQQTFTRMEEELFVQLSRRLEPELLGVDAEERAASIERILINDPETRDLAIRAWVLMRFGDGYLKGQLPTEDATSRFQTTAWPANFHAEMELIGQLARGVREHIPTHLPAEAREAAIEELLLEDAELAECAERLDELKQSRSRERPALIDLLSQVSDEEQRLGIDLP